MVADEVIDDAEMAIRTLRAWEEKVEIDVMPNRNHRKELAAVVTRIEAAIERYRVLGERERA